MPRTSGIQGHFLTDWQHCTMLRVYMWESQVVVPAKQTMIWLFGLKRLSFVWHSQLRLLICFEAFRIPAVLSRIWLFTNLNLSFDLINAKRAQKWPEEMNETILIKQLENGTRSMTNH